ncbi:unnamed protein product [Diatraea saccharalis]|uniref:Uncharacterized protein n=1 Tax=Diatraea saccharalis TaxID=40085 RepID=A0A9N9WH40_9NEOP|nr:unnamed protein product [Diatraea saccharalis]
MQALEPNTWIKHREDTLQQVRKILGLDKPGRLDEAIDILQDWAKKQPHFNQKEFDRNYLERCIIRSKGSVEKSKQHLENMCILKTITRQFFDNSSKPNELATDNIEEALMPRQTSDFCSIFLLRSRHREDYWEDLVYRCYCRGANVSSRKIRYYVTFVSCS